MGILDEIKNMKKMGMEEKEISNKLREKGVSPKSIEESFDQMKIKKAVSAESSEDEEMEPSIMEGNSEYEINQQAAPLYTPKTQEIEHNSEEFYAPKPNEEYDNQSYGNYNQEEYSPQETYEEQGGSSYDTSTFIEIAEQVFLEKIKKEQKQIISLNEFAILAETRISDHRERIKKIEEMLSKLQIAILEKIGSYGKNLDSIKNEMGMMQESFEKMVPSVHEKNHKKHARPTKKKTSKSKK